MNHSWLSALSVRTEALPDINTFEATKKSSKLYDIQKLSKNVPCCFAIQAANYCLCHMFMKQRIRAHETLCKGYKCSYARCGKRSNVPSKISFITCN